MLGSPRTQLLSRICPRFDLSYESTINLFPDSAVLTEQVLQRRKTVGVGYHFSTRVGVSDLDASVLDNFLTGKLPRAKQVFLPHLGCVYLLEGGVLHVVCVGVDKTTKSRPVVDLGDAMQWCLLRRSLENQTLYQPNVGW